MIKSRFILFIILFCPLNAFESDDADYLDGDPDLADYLREAIENFRNQMTKGIPEIKMPVLDPLVLRNMDINVNENVAKISLHIQEMTIRDLSKFTIHDLNPDLEKFYLKAHLSLPAVRANGIYKINGKLMKIFPIYGNGNFQINVSDASIAGEGKLEFAADTLQMDKMQLDLKWNNLGINLENFLGGGKFSDVLQKLLPKIGKGVFDHFRPEVMRLINKALTNEVNKQLRKPEVKKIVDGILPKY